MARNMLKISRGMIGKIPYRYDLTFQELMELLEEADSGKTAEAIEIAFNYGFALALRMQKNNAKR